METKTTKEYTHNNKIVKYDTIINDTFLNILTKNGIRPTELPDSDLQYRVFSYTINGNHHYATVIGTNVPDEYIEKVFITDEIPVDGFRNMIEDVDAQNYGSTPKKVKSRLSLVADKARKMAEEFVVSKYPMHEFEWTFQGYPTEIENEIRKMEKLYYQRYGYYKEMLDRIDAPDVNLEYVKGILK